MRIAPAEPLHQFNAKHAKDNNEFDIFGNMLEISFRSRR